MIYENIKSGKFLSRPNRFIAHVEIDGKVEICHVKNTAYLENITLIRPEYTYGSSRIDFYIESSGKRILAEVKGVTLEENGVVIFPDAPTERGVKHLLELCESINDDYTAYIAFIIQMENVRYFTPNNITGDTLKKAQACRVQILALDCHVAEDSITAKDSVAVRL